jgi:hypothetical protein
MGKPNPKFLKWIGKNVQNGKTEPVGITRRRMASEFVVLYSFRCKHRNSRFPLLLLCKIEKYFSILRGKTATKVSNGILDIANILERVLTKRRSFFVTKKALKSEPFCDMDIFNIHFFYLSAIALNATLPSFELQKNEK